MLHKLHRGTWRALAVAVPFDHRVVSRALVDAPPNWPNHVRVVWKIEEEKDRVAL